MKRTDTYTINTHLDNCTVYTCYHNYLSSSYHSQYMPSWTNTSAEVWSCHGARQSQSLLHRSTPSKNSDACSWVMYSHLIKYKLDIQAHGKICTQLCLNLSYLYLPLNFGSHISAVYQLVRCEGKALGYRFGGHAFKPCRRTYTVLYAVCCWLTSPRKLNLLLWLLAYLCII